MNIEAKTIPYAAMRYDTCGDYFWEGDVLKFRVNEMSNADYDHLVLIHEMVEEHLTRRRGLTEPDIMAFGLMWEKEREEGKHSEDDEPGHDRRAPYNKEHVLAENIERLIAQSMGVDWNEYATAVVNSCTIAMPT